MKHVILTFILCILPLSPLFGESNAIIKKKQRQEELHNEIKQAKISLSKKKKEKNRYHQNLGYIKRELRLEKKRLRRAESKLKKTVKASETTSKELVKLEKEYLVTLDSLSKRLSELYKNKNMGVVEFLFSPKNYEKALSQSYYFEKLLESDMSLLDELREKEARYKQKKIKLAKQSKQIKKLKKEILSKQKKLGTKTKRLEYTLSEIQKEINEFEKLNKLLQEESNQIADLIQKKTNKLRKFLGSGVFKKPTRGWVSSWFGYRRHPIFKRRILHSGIDFAAPKGRPIYAADHGKILFSGWKKGYGNVIIIDHGWKDNARYSTVYAHQSRRVAKKGSSVKKGQLIGYVGSTGYSTGPHLHFELRKNGKPINPKTFLKI